MPSKTTKAAASTPPRTYISAAQLAKRYGVTKMTVWQWARKGVLPKPYKFSEQITRWALDEIEACDAEKRRA